MKVTRLLRIGPKINPHHSPGRKPLRIHPKAIPHLGKPLRNVPNGAKEVGFKSRVGRWGSRQAGEGGDCRLRPTPDLSGRTTS